MIIYIHGFGSHGMGAKANILRRYCQERNIRFIAPSLSTIPDLAITTLEELIEAFRPTENVYLVGSSLGGYYALYLSHKYHIPCVLINPAIHPYRTLEKALEYVPSFYDQSVYEWNGSHLDMLRKYDVNPPCGEKTLLLVQTGDEVLDYTEAVEKLSDGKVVIEEGGNHGFEGFENYCESIVKFFSSETSNVGI
ncbi:YqiA/YcfP family alpha/beta fold hydrolase [Sulfuricurvum sp.]|uniref:YqiA/YcfP family alpha/beta fold hydrolase n=1 Tax=Sulfuricurvum sp. TaxID=2025608 RepID=UPI002634800D|nr:YqiA/YcfP family alpha/beta fold hydrolase [Sulfuricurvum sp.]MDD3595419.1 esterase [Sulfuricurvum sp.]